MMVNFLDPKLLPKIGQKPPCTDNYEPENLISKSFTEKLRGFIAYPALKPPVELEFEFLCNVSIGYVFIKSTVGAQKCSGLELFAKCGTSNYVSIARSTYDAEGIVFCNARKYSQTTPPPNYNDQMALAFFKGGSYKAFLNASHLKLTIFRTEKSVPCLASIEVWGTASKSCTPKTVATIKRLTMNVDQLRGSAETARADASCPDNDEFKIPDEFKDDLTCELMTIPYTLPFSGKTVDLSTLQKHIENERSFGRKPGDPFTGYKFTDSARPMINVPLKSRIDMFLLRNSHRPETFGLKRSLRSVNEERRKRRKDESSSVTSSNSSSDACNNIEALDELDHLIQKAKSDKNYLLITPRSEVYMPFCVSCKNDCHNLYEISCKHYYCRQCLLSACENDVCVKCNGSFKKSEARKAYL